MENNQEIDLLPKIKVNIITVLEQAGHDTSEWFFKNGGTEPVENPNANPSFCYRWSFSQEGKPSLLCLWFNSITIGKEDVIHHGNARHYALELETFASDRKTSPKAAGRARKHAKEARRLNTTILSAFNSKSPVYVAVVHNTKMIEDTEKSSAELRELDTTLWSVTEYDFETGDYTIRRGPIELGPTNTEKSTAKFTDQFGLDSPNYVNSSGMTVVRDKKVREAVLNRANGKCEYCGKEGFLTDIKGIYLETHHIIPLGEGGADRIFNVIAICPNDHRAAHHSSDRKMLQKGFKTYISEFYGNDNAYLEYLNKQAQVI